MGVDLRALLADLVADDFTAWGASVHEEFWQCQWCGARGADIDEEPREADHKPACPWLRARQVARENSVRSPGVAP